MLRLLVGLRDPAHLRVPCGVVDRPRCAVAPNEDPTLARRPTPQDSSFAHLPELAGQVAQPLLSIDVVQPWDDEYVEVHAGHAEVVDGVRQLVLSGEDLHEVLATPCL
eukprot:7634818-Lingulodinium_polyedra.AAC.1